MLFLVSEAKVDVCGSYVGSTRVRSGDWGPGVERVVMSGEVNIIAEASAR